MADSSSTITTLAMSPRYRQFTLILGVMNGMKPRVLLIGVTLWLGVIGVGSGVTLLMINQVGRAVTTQTSPPLAAPRVVAPPPGVSPGATTPEESPRSTPPDSEPEPSEVPSAGEPSATGVPLTLVPVTPSTPRVTPERPSTPTAKPPRAKRPPPPAGAPPRAPEPGPATVTRTWLGDAGRVSASCTGSRVALGSASPANGWRVEVDKRGPEEVEVTFEQGDGGPEVRVRARCVSGAPQFRVDRDD